MLGRKTFWLSKLIFADYFILRGRDTHIDFLRLLCLVGIFFDLFWNVKLFNAAKLRVLGCLISSKCLLDLNNYKRFSFCPWKWRFPVMFCHVGLSSLAFLAGCYILTDSDFHIQISKNGLQLKLKLHQLWRTSIWPSHDCSASNEFYTRTCLSKDNVGLRTFLHVPAHMITVGDFQSDWRKCNPIKKLKGQRGR